MRPSPETESADTFRSWSPVVVAPLLAFPASHDGSSGPRRSQCRYGSVPRSRSPPGRPRQRGTTRPRWCPPDPPTVGGLGDHPALFGHRAEAEVRVGPVAEDPLLAGRAVHQHQGLRLVGARLARLGPDHPVGVVGDVVDVDHPQFRDRRSRAGVSAVAVRKRSGPTAVGPSRTVPCIRRRSPAAPPRTDAHRPQPPPLCRWTHAGACPPPPSRATQGEPPSPPCLLGVRVGDSAIGPVGATPRPGAPTQLRRRYSIRRSRKGTPRAGNAGIPKSRRSGRLTEGAQLVGDPRPWEGRVHRVADEQRGSAIDAVRWPDRAAIGTESLICPPSAPG